MKARYETWKDLDLSWDIIVVGGGITGAGIIEEASKKGYKTLLLDAKDFAWGTSSRSSKMIHGGLRYLPQGQFGLTFEALEERESLLQTLPGLVKPLVYVFPHLKGQFPPPFLFRMLLFLYEFMSRRRTRRFFSKAQSHFIAPRLMKDEIVGASTYEDAITDDARLVTRVLHDAVRWGGIALNYTKVVSLKRDGDGQVNGVVARCGLTGEEKTLRASAVVNATGAWVDDLRGQINKKPVIRPLRGSHLVLAPDLLPVTQSITFFHPDDKRPVYAFPWAGRTVIGTTDIDHGGSIDKEASITKTEYSYLKRSLADIIPGSEIPDEQIISTYSGIRPVIKRGSGLSPSKEKRTHSLYEDDGLISITGGKLTTFRPMAREVMNKIIKRAVRDTKQRGGITNKRLPMPSPLTPLPLSPRVQGFKLSVPASAHERLSGFYGHHLDLMAEESSLSEWQQIPESDVYWAEISYILKQESVVHLDDLMLRRTRLGLILPQGGNAILPEVQALCEKFLGWDAQHFAHEKTRYQKIWQQNYSIPG